MKWELAFYLKRLKFCYVSNVHHIGKLLAWQPAEAHHPLYNVCQWRMQMQTVSAMLPQYEHVSIV